MLDIQRPVDIRWKAPLEGFLKSGRFLVRVCDVRDPQSLKENSADFDVMVNLAAIHREPGHKPAEYFETNVSGAQNVCDLAEAIGCREIVFTSSISVYGVHDRPVDEDSVVQPHSPYGQSKHQAEEIHRDWARSTGGRLDIIRPGVVFGPGEAGNVTRLVKEMLKRNRAIRLKPDLPKAGIYIKELVDIVHWLRNQPPSEADGHLINAVSNDNLTFNDYGFALQKIKGWTRPPVTIPGHLLRSVVALMNPLAGLVHAGSRFHPQRIAKLFTANDIRPSTLNKMGYPFSWPLELALADWLEKGL